MNGLASLLVAAIVSVTCAGSTVRAAGKTDPVVSNTGDLIEFSRHCADENRYRVQTYALFASPSKHARALVQVQIGFVGLERTIRVLAGLEALALDAGMEWGERSYALVLALLNVSGRTIESLAISTWIDHTGWGENARSTVRNFVTTADGQTRWLTFVEPDERPADAGMDGHRIIEPMQLPVGDLELQDQNESIALSVIIRDLESDEEIRMTGPSMRIPKRMWAMKPPVSRVLNLPQSLNPFQEGGIPRVIGRAWKYRGCIKERKEAKKLFRSFR